MKNTVRNQMIELIFDVVIYCDIEKKEFRLFVNSLEYLCELKNTDALVIYALLTAYNEFDKAITNDRNILSSKRSINYLLDNSLIDKYREYQNTYLKNISPQLFEFISSRPVIWMAKYIKELTDDIQH